MRFPIRSKRGRRAGLVLIAAIACVVAAVTAQASAVGLGTAQSFVVLAGSTATNTGPSVLNGDLGVAPGTALVGFGLPAVVNGATHAADGVAAQAQLDLTTAYDVAASQAGRGHGDGRYDEFRVTQGGRLIHEIEWAAVSETGRWLIEASDVAFKWIPWSNSATL